MYVSLLDLEYFQKWLYLKYQPFFLLPFFVVGLKESEKMKVKEEEAEKWELRGSNVLYVP